MALFKKKETESKQDVAQAPAEPTVGKGRPTPKRKDAEARNLRPLVPENTKEQRKLAKQKLRERENREYEAMRTGDLNNMPKAERRHGAYTPATTSMRVSTSANTSFPSHWSCSSPRSSSP